MLLYFSPTSPFVRKVRIVAIETGLIDRIDLVTDSPFEADSTVRERNPLGKVPALVTDDGLALYDSPVICEYLDALHDGPRMFPTGDARWTALRRQALADGIMDATLLRRLETTRSTEPSVAFIQRQEGAVRRSLAALEAEDLRGVFDIGVVSVICALGYIDLRFRELAWRSRHPRLSDWLAEESRRTSVATTRPPRVRSATLRGK